MRGRALILALIGGASIGSTEIAAQVPDTLLNQRIRVHLARQDRSLEGNAPRQALRGVLTELSRDSLTIRFHPLAAPVSVAVTGIHQIDVSRGISRGRSALRNALLGGAYMGGLGALGDYEWGGGDTENYLIWTAGGIVIGAVMGAILPEEGWRSVFRR
jgi:hypothetical protein